ncbi:MAG: hypothetical protein JWO30_55 [Fibrobacteres bacterium]|nr:hypothetical protein [Fibrobacterota bacterium]
MGQKNRYGGAAKNRFEGMADVATPSRARHLSFNFKDLDPSQSKTFLDWEARGWLAKACERMKGYSSQTVPQCYGKKFKIYDSWPGHSKFKPPRHVIEDAQWASMHIQGQQCLGGHMIGDVFYVVFLDEEHDLWPTELKHT